MKIQSTSFEHAAAIAPRYALGAPDGFGGNVSPQLAWSDAPAETRSFVVMCIDTDAPTDASLAGQAGVEIPVEHPRGNFVHWVVANLPADARGIDEGMTSGVVARGKPACARRDGAIQGLNDYTGWFAGDTDMAGRYHGWDGPYPPPNDLRVHRYFFRVFALDVAQLALGEDFTAGDVFTAMQGHVLAEAATWCTYSLNPRAG